MSGTTASIFSGQPTPPQPTGQDVTTTTPLWAQQAQYQDVQAAQNLANQQYQAYPGQQVATPSAATQQAWNMATGSVGNYQPYLNSATGALNNATNLTNAGSQVIPDAMNLSMTGSNTANAAATPIGAGQINQYMNPYTQNVIGGLQQAAQSNLVNNQMPAISSQFVGAGQAASPQMAQADSNMLYQSNQALDQATSQALQSGYSGALGTALQEQSTGMQNASLQGQFGGQLASEAGQLGAFGQQQAQYGAEQGQLGALTQQLGAAQTGEVAAAGQAQDTTNQANINAAMNNFYSQQQWPYQNLAYASNILSGQNIPTNTQTVGMNYNPGQSYTASPLSSFIGTTLGASALQNGSNNAASTLYAKGGRVKRKPAQHVHKGALSAMLRAA